MALIVLAAMALVLAAMILLVLGVVLSLKLPVRILVRRLLLLMFPATFEIFEISLFVMDPAADELPAPLILLSLLLISLLLISLFLISLLLILSTLLDSNLSSRI